MSTTVETSMSQLATLELNHRQREILLRGLRFVRNAVALDLHEPDPQYVEKRTSQLAEISALAELVLESGSDAKS